MSTESNKAVVLSYYEALRDADIDRMSQLLADDLAWWIAPTTRFSGTYAKGPWLELIKAALGEIAGSSEVSIIDLTAQDDRVSVTSHGRMTLKSGVTYENDYHLLFFIKDGKISRCKEYMDSYRTGLGFGFPVNSLNQLP